MRIKAKIINGRLVIEIEDLPLIPEKVELYGGSEYATYFLETAWTDIIKDANVVKRRLRQFGLDDLVDGLIESGFDKFQLNIKNYAVMYEVMITAIRDKRGDLTEVFRINEKMNKRKSCEVSHFETYKDKTQITILCEVKTV